MKMCVEVTPSVGQVNIECVEKTENNDLCDEKKMRENAEYLNID